MLKLTDIRGLKFPDEFFVRYFYKRGHDRKTGRVLELGCGNGNNLALYDAYDWDVTGVDISRDALDAARHNLQGRGHFLHYDLAQGPLKLIGPFDVLLMPSSMYYIPREAFVSRLHESSQLMKAPADIYLRMRLLDDYRYGKGTSVERNGFRLTMTETGESGCLNIFYSADELIDLLKWALGVDPSKLIALHNRFGNVQSNMLVQNSEVIIWSALD
jgi:SAM-dependent methyltransferase